MDAPRLLDAGHSRQPHDQQHETQPEHRNRPDTLLCLRLHHLAPHLSAKWRCSLNFCELLIASCVTFHMGSFTSDAADVTIVLLIYRQNGDVPLISANS